ncbi:MAG: ABC transporter ATP-binding protein [Treponemataceae bacterium]
MTKHIIEARGIERTYRKGPKALKNVDLVVKEGSRFALLGPNGAGKSTLIRILCTLSRADAGTVRIDDIPLKGNTVPIRSRIGVALQEAQIDPTSTVRAQLLFQGRLYGMDTKKAKERAADLESRFGLNESSNRKAKDLSGGNLRRLHVALALVHFPKLLFLDEPTVGMDPEVRALFWEELLRLNREEGTSILFSTQYLEEAEKHAEDLAIIDEGIMTYRGTVKGFIDEHGSGILGEGLEEGYLAFLGKADREAIHA